jgi:hypothetical protein
LPPQQKREETMHAVLRQYSGNGARALVDALEKNRGDVESLMRGVPGFVSYSLVRAGDGGFSVSVFQSKAGADESVKKAREWISKNAGQTGAAAPTVADGTVILHVS